MNYELLHMNPTLLSKTARIMDSSAFNYSFQTADFVKWIPHLRGEEPFVHHLQATASKTSSFKASFLERKLHEVCARFGLSVPIGADWDADGKLAESQNYSHLGNLKEKSTKNTLGSMSSNTLNSNIRSVGLTHRKSPASSHSNILLDYPKAQVPRKKNDANVRLVNEERLEGRPVDEESSDSDSDLIMQGVFLMDSDED